MAACASGGRSSDASLAAVWHHYRQLPAHRALAVAGDPKRGQWVAGMAGGGAAPIAAEEAALRECRARRHEQRAQAMCQLYAVEDEIVWPGP